MVMEASDMRDGNNLTSRAGRLFGPVDRAILRNRHVRAPMVVVLDVLSQDSAQMVFVDYNYVI